MAKRRVDVNLIAKTGESERLGALKLLSGEFGVTVDDGKLYIGNGTGTGNEDTGYDGKILINPDQSEKAIALTNPRVIAITGAGAGQAIFDGTEDVSIELILTDSGVAAGTYTKVKINDKGIVTEATTLTAEDIPTLELAKIIDAGDAASKNVGILEGQVPILGPDGKLNDLVIPKSAITDVYNIETEEAMLELDAEIGDVAIRLDKNMCFILGGDGDPTIVDNWKHLKTPTDMVYSVNNHTGPIITLTAEDIGLEHVVNESKSTMFNNPVFTGNAKTSTPAVDDNSTAIANTEWIVQQGFLRGDEAIILDGGTF